MEQNYFFIHLLDFWTFEEGTGSLSSVCGPGSLVEFWGREGAQSLFQDERGVYFILERTQKIISRPQALQIPPFLDNTG